MPNVRTNEDFLKIYEEAFAAGQKAVEELNIAPMIVSQHENPLDDSSPIRKSYYVADGVCGFAWVQIKPANGKFAKWLIDQQIARKSIYDPGIRMSIHWFEQSYQKKDAFARAFAKVLQGYDINAIPHSRLD